MFIPLPVDQVPFLDPSTDIRNPRSRIKTVMILIIISIVFLLILISTVTIMLEKKKPPILPNVSTVMYTSSPRSTTVPSTISPSSVSTTIRPSSIPATMGPLPISTEISPPPILTTTTSVVSINNMTTSSSTTGSSSTGCQLPLIPKYNTNKIVVAGSDLPGSNVYELNKPIAIALDSTSNLFVADAGNFRVLKYIPNSNKGEIILGHGTDRLPRASNIIGLFIDKNDLLYTYQYDESYHSQVIVWPSSSKNGTVIKTGSDRIAAFTVDRDLNIYTARGINLQIYMAPTYRQSVTKRLFGKPYYSGLLPTGTSSIYLDPNSNLFVIDIQNHRIQKNPIDDEYSETIVERSPTLLAIIGDCHNNLYTIDSNSSLIIYSSTGDVISTMHNAIDNPFNSDSWEYNSISPSSVYIPDYFASLVLDLKNGDLYVIMRNYDRVTKFTLN